MANQVTITAGVDGAPDQVESTPILGPGTEAFDGAVERAVEEKVQGIQLSRAKARQAALRRNDLKPVIEEVEIGGEKWYIRRLGFEGINRIMLKTPRNGTGKFLMEEDGALTSLLAAMLHVALVVGPEDTAPWFESWDDAFSQAFDTDENLVVVNNLLFNEILRLNPGIWPEGAAAVEKLSKEQSEAPLG